uniref:CCHC-type domain-containing protein n=2 Tax=Physcomitrium patens TaxID=3218 RepID=A0A2K1K0D2_PHYPA|nr:hypothetical protein PHYPA_014354 [Physcomitrium patens]
MIHQYDFDYERRIKQKRDRQLRLAARNVNRIVGEVLQKRRRRQSWIKPWLHACRHIRSYSVPEREAIFQNYIPLSKLPLSLAGDSSSLIVKSVKRFVKNRIFTKEFGSLFQGALLPNKFKQLDVPTGPPVPPIGPIGPAVPISVPMGQVGDQTTSIAPLPIFSGWPGADPDQHLSQFLTACVANNGRTEDVWLRWLPATLKDTAFEWYNRQPVGSFPNWEALRAAFLLHFRPIGYEDRLREQLMRSHMIPGEAVESYYGRVADIIRRWPNNHLHENFILSILINGLYPSELKMFVKENQPTTVALSLVRAKVWEECHYDRILNSNPILIPTQGSSKFPNWNNLANSITGAMAPATHSTVPIQGVLNPVPLQAVPSPMASTYPEFAPYQPPGVNTQELPMLPGSKETNEMLLLNLTKKMEELAVNMAKEKEKRPKQTNFRTNVWCTNCKGQGHMVQDCPSPGNMKIQCMNCGGKHPTNNCWYLSNPHFNNTMSPSMSWDVNQIQGSNGNGWNGNRFNNQNRNYSNNQNFGPNSQKFHPNQRNYQGNNGFMPEPSLQTGQPGSFTQATWNIPSRYIPIETSNIPSGMG